MTLRPNEAVTSVSCTPSAKRLMIQLKSTSETGDQSSNEFDMFLWIREWRDDFDPNNTKASRNQVWCNTYTILPPTTEHLAGSNTYFMGVSGKGDDHRVVEQMMSNELEHLSESQVVLFHGGLRKKVRVHIGKLYVSVDRPERTAMFQIGDHNGSYSTCWGYATFVDGTRTVNHLPACNDCRKKRISRLSSTNNSQEATPATTCSTCCDWRLEDTKMIFLAPKDYPLSYDMAVDAPLPPPLRDLWFRKEEIQVESSEGLVDATEGDDNEMNNAKSNDQQVIPIIDESVDVGKKKKRRKKSKPKPTYKIYLRTVKLTITWLKQAICFAYHQIKTVKPNARNQQKFWTKGNFVSFLKTCGCTNKIIDSLFAQAVSKETEVKIPVSWYDVEALTRCHYAPMHMLFLGNAKSNIEMVSSWLGKWNKLATFGKQANRYLLAIRALRCTKYFASQPLSTSTWGTGVWVSENYLFGSRLWKFLVSIPAISDDRSLRNTEYKDEYQAIIRFMSSMNLCFSRIMTNRTVIPLLHEYILLYMDCMVEIDDILLRAEKQKRKANFVKSNSLGMLSCAVAHDDMGPALLHWEGGYSGERKIQQMKPLLHIKRSNTDWTRITMRKLYQQDTLEWMMRNIQSECTPKTNNRQVNSLLKIYKNRDELLQAITRNDVLCGFVGTDCEVHLAYRPVGEESGNTRVQVKTLMIEFRDDEGCYTTSKCWVAPIRATTNTVVYKSLSDLLKDFIAEVILLLPQISTESDEHMNSYYCLGNHWRERTSTGFFDLPSLNDDVFRI